MRRARSLLAIWPPIVFGLVFLVVWETIVAVYDIKKFLLPAPTAIASAFAGNLENVWEAVLRHGRQCARRLLYSVCCSGSLSASC